MTLYETMLIYSPELAETAAKKEVSHFKTKISKEFGGEVSFEDFWGKRDLAYPIQKKDSGFYVVLQYTFPSEKLREYDEELRLDKNILRHLTVKVPKTEENPLTFEEIQKEEEEFIEEMVSGKRKVRKISSRKETLDMKK
jgi:small subunit ribosomal protein S6